MLRRDSYDTEDLLRIGEAAAFVDVHPDTLRRWVAAGKVACSRTPTNQRRFRVGDLRAVMELEDDAAAATSSSPVELARGVAS